MNKNNITPWSLFESSCEKYSERNMVVYGDKKISYNQMHKKTLEFVNSINRLDFTMAGIFLPNSADFIKCLLGLNKMKKVVIPLSYQLKGESLYERIIYADIELIVTDNKGYEEICRVKDKIDIKSIIVLNDSTGIEIHEFQCNPKLLDGISEDTFGICFTGGSTSSPKGVVLSNGAVAGNAVAVADFLNFSYEDKFLMARPFTQAGPIASDMLMCISRGGEIIILNDLYHPAVFLKAVEEYKATTTYMVRTMLVQILEYSKLKNYNLSSMRRIILGAMITPESVIDEVRKKLPGLSLYNAYGLSEASVRVSFCGPEDIFRYPGSVGKPIKGCSVKVYLENGNEAKPGDEGEIYVLTDYVMDGYYKHTEKTKETLTQRGLRTRDRGYINDKGYLYIVGRADDLIIQGGNNVYPIEIEEILLRNKNVCEAAVLGVKDEKLGQKIVALVRVKEKSDIKLQDLFKWCRMNLEDRKIPKEIYIADVIPKNEMGKINKHTLNTLYKTLYYQKNNYLENRGNT